LGISGTSAIAEKKQLVSALEGSDQGLADLGDRRDQASISKEALFDSDGSLNRFRHSALEITDLTHRSGESH
jgi:hypothetical protein